MTKPLKLLAIFMAAVFLAARVAAEEKKRQFTMIDVLRSGAM